MKSILNSDFQIIQSDNDFDYQKKLTSKLDYIDSDFNQEIVNEIVLWKVNRYAELSNELISKINQIKKTDLKVNETLTREILFELLNTKGVKLPMASTILRFRNPRIFQIIDQRVYRIIYDEKLKLPYNRHLPEQIDLYLKYLTDLRIVADKLKIPFELSDRILFMADRRLNKDDILDNY